ncbi:glycerophosphodiester phosphodiesterase [Thalassotalea euphylliae]|uniref:glycerophosphodiester phosphodiesterase n=1 Tax=Thalassotalea euphylliae TaxID=1655234 RepID=A0A3E0TP53_9GAMM|nr:glycerophosphodiester phosphodiesterase [Thalassotalea euphylliae]REL26304.1 glycerophosphodiester phosphodiesterase [Thalassotalea euphylliae]
MMKNTFLLCSALVVSAVLWGCQTTDNVQPSPKNDKRVSLTRPPVTIIAHRGASGHLPEHTMASKALAYGMGADFIEQDVVMTKDDHLLVHHDLTLDATTNVATVFPDRKRQDGHFYVIDFTLAELKKLHVFERLKSTETTTGTATGTAKYPKRFPTQTGDFRLHTFAEELTLIQALNASHQKNVGIYPEVKSPWFHHQAGKDISSAVLSTLKTYGYTQKADNVYLQSFDANELKRIKHELLPKFGMTISLVQLVAYTDWQETQELVNNQWQNYRYDWMFTRQGVADIAEYADGVGPWFPMLVDDNWQASAFLKAAQQFKLAIHPYTYRIEDTPERFDSYDQWLQFTYAELGIDGFFSDFPAKSRAALTSR